MKLYMVLNIQEESGESVVAILTTEKEAERLVKIKTSEGVSPGSYYEAQEIYVYENAEQVIKVEDEVWEKVKKGTDIQFRFIS